MRNLFYVALIFTLAISCQKPKEASEQSSLAFETIRKTFLDNLLDPTEAAAQLQATGAEFNGSKLHNPDLAASYTGNEVKAAANMGIYLADLNYCVAYQKAGDNKQLFTVANELAKSVGIDQTVLNFLSQRYENNLQQNDSARAVLNDLLTSAAKSLQGTEREKFLGIAMSAYQVENLYLALGVIQAYPKDMLPDDVRLQILIPVFRMVLNQRTNLETIYAFVSSIPGVDNLDKYPNYPYYSTALQELIGVYQNLDIEAKIANNRGIELMNDAVVNELSEKVNVIRNRIVSVE